MYSGGYENAFTVSGGQLENSGMYETAHFFIHETILALSGDDVNLVCAHHIMEDTGMNACSVDDQFRMERSLTGYKTITGFLFLNVCYFRI